MNTHAAREILSKNKSQSFVPPEDPSFYGIGRLDARDGNDCNPSAYCGRQWQVTAYVAGYSSIRPEQAAATMAGVHYA